MRIKNLNYFIEIEKHGSINKAARKMNTSPQNLSRIIKVMEDELGTTLLIRNNNGIEFTKDGYIFLDFCKDTKKSFNRTILELSKSEENKLISGTVRFYATTVMMEFLFNELIVQFKQHFPKINIQTIEVDAVNGYYMIEDDEKAIGALSSLPIKDKFENLEFEEIMDLEVSVLVNKNHRFASKPSVHIEDVVKEDLIVFALTDLKLTDTYIMIKNYYSEEFSWDTTSNINAFFNSVSRGNNVAFVCNHALEYRTISNEDDVVVLELEGVSNELPFALITNRKANFSEAENCFLSFVKKYLDI